MWENRGKLSSTAPLVFRHQQLNCRLVSGLEPPRTCRFLRCLRNSRIEEGGMVRNRFTRPSAKNARRRICKVWLGSDLQSAVSARFRQRYKLLNLLQVLGMAAIVFIGPRL